MKTKTLIPKGYFRCAHSEIRSGTGTVYYNPERDLLLIVVDDSIVGSFPASKIECVDHVIRDVKGMKGRYGRV